MQDTHRWSGGLSIFYERIVVVALGCLTLLFGTVWNHMSCDAAKEKNTVLLEMYTVFTMRRRRHTLTGSFATGLVRYQGI